jgi:hypothetical protein
MMRQRKDYAVFNDVDIKKFRYWRDVLGCQTEICITGKYERESKVEWGVPTIWCCNKDMDPRKFRAARDYIRDNCVPCFTS